MKWTGKGKDSPSVERQRRLMVKEAREYQKHRRRLQAIKDKLDLFGEGSLDVPECKLVEKHHDFFYPEEG